jgi:Tfp pilus assembly protein PilF
VLICPLLPATRATRKSDRRRSPSRSASPHKRSIPFFIPALVIIAAGLAAYANSFDGILVFDDEPAIAENEHIRQLRPLAVSMSAPDDTTLSGRPVASLTFAINYALAPHDERRVPARSPDGASAERFHSDLRGYHAMNLAIHLLAGLALFGVLRRTLLTSPLRERFGRASTTLAGLVALIWVLHPLQTASVTYVVQRVESLMGLFYLLTLYCAIRALPAGPRARRLWSVAAVIACGLGMGTKEVMASAPVMVMTWDALFARDRVVRRWPLYAGLAATWIVLAILVAGAPRSFSVGFRFAEWPWWRYLMTQSDVVVHYLRLSFIPTPLVLDYDWRPATSLRDVVPSVALLAVLLGATGWGLLRRSPWGFAGAWFFALLAPTSSFLPIVTEVAAEHRMYLPLAAVVSVVVLGMFGLGRGPADTPSAPTRFASAGILAAVLVAAVFGQMTYRRNADYHDYERIWSDTIAKRPRNARARNNYATALLARQAFHEAEPHLRIAVAVSPGFAEAETNLGVALCAQGSFDEGIAHMERAIEIQPDFASGYRNIAEAHATQGKMAAAVGYYSKALSFQPDDVDLLNRIAWILATTELDDLRDGERALQLADRAARLTNRQDVISLDTVAAALAELGHFERAADTAREALNLARVRNDQAIGPELADRLRLYQSRERFRQRVRPR